MGKQLLNNRHLVIATMHSKERIIAPLLQESFQLSCSVPELNTDLLGTFSGEIPRADSALNTARKKCELAFQKTDCDLAIASEGSFGSHPTIPFTSANEELILLIDKQHGLEVVGKHLTHLTNFNGTTADSIDQVLDFAQEVHFPSHGLIIRENSSTAPVVAKGIVDHETLVNIVSEILSRGNEVWMETDMRAQFNPTRMNAIEQATINLIQKLKSYCPTCAMPGFWITDYKKGLPCSWCHFPTESTLATIWSCNHCDHSEEVKFPNEKKEEDPIFCGVCNP